MRLIGWLSLVVVALAAARALDPLPEGLTATHFSDTNWTSAPVRSQLDNRPSTDGLFAAWRGSPPDRFSATWRGSLIVLRGGSYTFAVESDDGSWLYVDGQLLVDNGGQHETRRMTGNKHLDSGVHSLFIKYFQDGGGLSFDLLWGPEANALKPIPSWALAPRAAEFYRFLLSVLLRRALVWASIVWLAAVVFTGAKAAGHARWPLGRRSNSCSSWLAPLCSCSRCRTASWATLRYRPSSIDRRHQIPTTPYSMVGPLLSAPLYWIGTFVLGSEWWCARFNTIVFLIGLWIMARLLRDRVSTQVRAAFLLLLLACSMFMHHLEGYFAEAFTAMFAGVGLLAVDAGYPLAGWTATIVGVINTPASLVGLGSAAVVHMWNTRRVRHLLPVAVAAAGIMLESWIRRGSPFVTGYEGNHGDTTMLTYSGRPGFSYPFAFGVLSILLSFGKGLLFFAPGLLLHVKKPAGFFILWIAFLAGLIAVYAKWWAWFGGLFWGPRFFVVASLPASFAIAWWLPRLKDLATSRRLALFLVLTLSAWVAIDGAVFGSVVLTTCRDARYEWLCLYVPEFSPLWRPFVEWVTPPADRAIVGMYVVVVYLWLAVPLVTSFAREMRERRRVARVTSPASGRFRF